MPSVSARLTRLAQQLNPAPVAETPKVSGRVLRINLRPPADPAQPHKYAGGADRTTFQRSSVKSAKITELGLEGDLCFSALAAHTKRDKGEKLEQNDVEMAILAQSPEHYAMLRNAFPQKADMKVTGKGEHKEEIRMSGEGAGSGEQLYIDGLHKHNVCIGDEFAVVSPDGARKGLLQVAAPRRPCSNWDKKYEALGQGAKGVRHFVLTTTTAGWFFRVLEVGEVAEGDTIQLVKRIHPMWTLHTVGDKLYGAAGPLPKDWAKWTGSLEELTELSNIEELGIMSWREDAEELRATATGTPVRDFALSESVKTFGSVTAHNEFALFSNRDEPEPGYFRGSETFQKAMQLQKHRASESS